MSRLLYNVLLALAWVAVTGHFTFSNALVGFLLAFGVMLIARDPCAAGRYARWVPRTITLAVFFLLELVRANLRVAYETVTPTERMRPAVVAVPLEARTDLEILLLATLLTLTPDSLAVDLSPDRRTLYVHSMYAPDLEAARQRIKRTFERRILEVTR